MAKDKDENKTAPLDAADLAPPMPDTSKRAPWAKMVKLNTLTPERLQQALYDAGILTVADLRHNPNGAFGVLQALYGVDLSALLLGAEKYADTHKE